MIRAVRTRQEGERLIVTVQGPLVLSTTPGIRDELQDVEDLLPSCLILDLREVTDVDSSGLALVLWLHRAQTNRSCEFIVVSNRPELERALSATMLDRALDVRPALPPRERQDPR